MPGIDWLSRCSTLSTAVVRKRSYGVMMRLAMSPGDMLVKLKATPITGTPMVGKISVGVRTAAIGPKIRINRAMTIKVRGRSSATRTIQVMETANGSGASRHVVRHDKPFPGARTDWWSGAMNGGPNYSGKSRTAHGQNGRKLSPRPMLLLSISWTFASLGPAKIGGSSIELIGYSAAMLSQKSRYALRALLVLAAKGDTSPVQISKLPRPPACRASSSSKYCWR